MCTLTFVAHPDGYLLGMNRDERANRGIAELPSETTIRETKAIYPRDVEGGTWIGANEHGVAFALLNWHGETAPGVPLRKIRTRGLVIPRLLQFASLPEAEAALRAFDVDGILPFRLIGVFPAEAKIREWTWDLGAIQSQDHFWRHRHWFSSGRSQQQAELLRGGACRRSWAEADAGEVAWLRRLHASHANGPGAFSVCVHTDGVQTVSYTEIEYSGSGARLTYVPGNPCQGGEPAAYQFQLAGSSASKML